MLRCQHCGYTNNLQIRSEFSRDPVSNSEVNLITLCVTCHGSVHLSECKTPDRLGDVRLIQIG